jgi:energy-coupling factor transporter ATP-binding protein EcfA2
MKVATLLTWNWGSVDNREWQLADTVLLTGESGSGKSTLLDSLQTLLTAAHNHIVQFNVGQDESTQSRKGGKEPRTLQAYALGQQAEGVFLRSRSTSYVAAVLVPSEAAGETLEPFTAIIGVEAHEEAGKASLARQPMYLIVRKPLSLEHLLQADASGKATGPLPLKELYTTLQARLRAGSEVVQRYEDKTSYLTRLYGATMGKASISELEAHRAAKSLVKAMAYKELGNVNDLVRDEILDFHDLSKDLETMRSLMKTIAGLHESAKRLNENMGRLRDIDEAASKVVDDARKFVVNTIASAIRAGRRGRARQGRCRARHQDPGAQERTGCRAA